jgi:hypothetical protein
MRIFPDPEARLRAVRRSALYFGERLLWFGVEDTHSHHVVEAAPGRIRYLARDLGCILARTGAVAFRPPYVQPVETRRHLENCWPYVLGNADVHGLGADLAWLDASGIPDLVGARLLPGFDPLRWKRHLPRRTLAEMLETLNLRVPEAMPIPDLRALGASRIASAAAAAIGWPDLGSNTPVVVDARAAATRLALEAGIGAAEVAHALSVDPRIVRRLRSRAESPALALAIRRRLDLERAWRR